MCGKWVCPTSHMTLSYVPMGHSYVPEESSDQFVRDVCTSKVFVGLAPGNEIQSGPVDNCHLPEVGYKYDAWATPVGAAGEWKLCNSDCINWLERDTPMSTTMTGPTSDIIESKQAVCQVLNHSSGAQQPLQMKSMQFFPQRIILFLLLSNL